MPCSCRKREATMPRRQIVYGIITKAFRYRAALNGLEILRLHNHVLVSDLKADALGDAPIVRVAGRRKKVMVCG
jgi:hypothetical protein